MGDNGDMPSAPEEADGLGEVGKKDLGSSSFKERTAISNGEAIDPKKAHGGGSAEKSIRPEGADLTSEIEEDPQPEKDASDSSSLREKIAPQGESASVWDVWAGGWNLSKVGGVLKELAAETARDVKGLKDSLQNAFAEEEVVEEEHDSGSGSTNVLQRPTPEEEMRRDSILQRLTDDKSVFEQGMKAIDDQVEQLAVGVGKTLSSVWGGIGGAMKKVSQVAAGAGKEIVETVEDGIRDVRELDAVKSASSHIKTVADNLAAKSAKGLNMVRRTFSSFDGTDYAGATDEEEPVTFDSWFYICGGEQCVQELEALANDCARKCNRARVKLDDEGKTKLDHALAEVGPIFDIEGCPSDGEDDDVKPVSITSDLPYTQVEALKARSIEEAGTMASNAVDRLAEWAGPLETPRSARSMGTPRDAGVDLQEGVSKGTDALVEIQVEGIKKLAEVCACGVRRLLSLGHSLVPVPDARAKGDEVEWPQDHVEIAKMLRAHTQRIASDTQAVAGAFVEAVLGVGAAYSERLRDGSVSQEAGSLASDMEVDGGAAVARIHEGLRNLLYASICTTLDASKLPS